MRKTAFFMGLLALLEGAAGFVLRRTELETVFQENGLAVIGEPVSVALWGLVGLALLSALVFALAAMGRTVRREGYDKAFGFSQPTLILIYFLISAAVAAGAVLYVRDAVAAYNGITRAVRVVLACLGFASAVSFYVVAVGTFKRRLSGGAKALSTIPPLFLCMWMVLTYQINATNPVILDFGYRCVALAAASLSFYYASGYAFGRNKPSRTAGVHFFAVVLCMITLADVSSLAETLMIAAVTVMLLVELVLFTENTRKKF